MMKLAAAHGGKSTLDVDYDDETAALTITTANGSRRSIPVSRKELLEALGWGHVEGDACPAEARAAALEAENRAAEERARHYADDAGRRRRNIAKLEELLAKRNRQVMALVDLLTKED